MFLGDMRRSFVCLASLFLGSTSYSFAVDSDGDGVSDELEVQLGTDPNRGGEYAGDFSDTSVFTYGFNLYDDWSRFLHGSFQAEVYQERSAGNAKFWRPTANNQEGYLTYLFTFDQPLRSARLKFGIYAWTQGADVNFDQNARAYLEVSTNNSDWHMIDYMEPGHAALNSVFDISQHVDGANELFIRSRLKGTRTWGGDGLIFAQALRTSPSDTPSFLFVAETKEVPPAVPSLSLATFYESPSGEAIAIDATPTAGFPRGYTYQWCFNGFKIPANLGGTASSINIDSLQANEGTWSVTVTNETGSVEQSFEYRVYVDSDSDGLSDAFEELVSLTNINKPDTDNDGLVDGDEVNTYRTNPNSSDSDSDGFTDLYELETAYDPNSAESTPDAQVNIMTAIEVDFNAALGATYEIQFSTDTIEWTVIEAGIVGEGNAVERLYSRKDFPTGFFRVERTDQ